MKRYHIVFFSLLFLSSLSYAIETILVNPGSDYPSSADQVSSQMLFPFPIHLEENFLTLAYQSEISCVLELTGSGNHSTMITLPPKIDPDSSFIVEKAPGFPLASLILRDIQGNPVSYKLKLTDRETYESSWPKADQSVILSAPFTEEKDFYLYRWSLKDDILVFDFMSYEIQDRYFKRLAFFMEKPGYRGTLMTNEEMEGLHGWNAHDYSTQGLSSFFNLAEKEQFILNREELDFLDILLKKGILLYDGEAYIEGEGAVISISQESGLTLRQRFFTHEIFHGLFFSDNDFHNEIRDYWNKMPPEYRKIWRSFMVFNFYDPKDETLMYNELMGYTLQLERSQVAAYFIWRFNKIKELHPEQKNSIDSILDEVPRVMLQIYDDLGEIVSRRYSYQNGYFQDSPSY